MFLKPLKTLEFAVTVLAVRHPVHRVLHALAFGYFGSGSFSNPMPSRPVGSKNAGVAKGYAALWTGYPRLARRRKMQVHSLCGLAFGCHKGLLHCYEPRLVRIWERGDAFQEKRVKTLGSKPGGGISVLFTTRFRSRKV